MKNNLAYCESILYTYTEREEEAYGKRIDWQLDSGVHFV